MHANRSSRRGGCRWLLFATPIVVLVVVLGVLVFPVIPELLMQNFGFERHGDAESFWQEMGTDRPSADEQLPQPTIADGTLNYSDAFQQASIPASVHLDSNTGSIDLTPEEVAASTALMGQSVGGFPLGVFVFGPSVVPAVCSKIPNDCTVEGFKLVGIEMHLNGAVVNVATRIAGFQQTIGIAVITEETSALLVPVGIVLLGQLYDMPTDGEIARVVNDVVDQFNDLLNSVEVIAAGHDSMRLVGIEFFEDQLAVIVR